MLAKEIEMSESFIQKMPKYPVAIMPIYQTIEANETIKLYEGNLELAQNNLSISCNGKITFEWLPRPSVRLESSPNTPFAMLELGQVTLRIPSLSQDLEAFLTNITRNSEGLCTFSGRLRRTKIIWEKKISQKILFNVANFHNFVGDIIQSTKECTGWCRGRLELLSDTWKVILDQVNHSSEFMRKFESRGGFLVTHIGSVERIDGHEFSYEEAEKAINALHYFLSFLRGFWCGPVLPVGIFSDQKTWEQWDNLRLTPWKEGISWFPKLKPNDIGQAFKGFMKKCEDPLWGVPIGHAIHWYVEANLSAGAVEGSIILIQAALELLGWVYLVEDTKQFGSSKFENLPAEQKLRELLKTLNIPTTIPPELSDLKNAAALLRTTDGPSIFVRLRNGLVHPKKNKRNLVSSTAVAVRIQAWTLGLWYLELLLLRLFNYSGVYYRRFISGYPDRVEALVPWA